MRALSPGRTKIAKFLFLITRPGSFIKKGEKKEPQRGSSPKQNKCEASAGERGRKKGGREGRKEGRKEGRRRQEDTNEKRRRWGGEWEGWRDDGKKDRLRERERERGGVLCHCV